MSDRLWSDRSKVAYAPDVTPARRVSPPGRGLVALALSIVGLAGCGNGSDLAQAGRTQTVFVTRTATQTVTVPQTVPVSTELTDPTEPTQSTEGGSAPSGQSSSPLALGTFGQVGRAYRVAVEVVNQNADQLIEATNEFNGPPEGRYVLVGLSVEYTGQTEGDPWIDLDVKYVGTDARQYDTYQCGAVVPEEGSEVPTLEHGGRATYQVCFDMPASAIRGGRIFVAPSFSFDDSRVYWSSS